jgi:hypothetical protein
MSEDVPHPQLEAHWPRPKHECDDYVCAFCGMRLDNGDEAFKDTCNECAKVMGWFD